VGEVAVREAGADQGILQFIALADADAPVI
jgi:hypothetical protein